MLRSERDYNNKIYILSNIYERTVVNIFFFLRIPFNAQFIKCANNWRKGVSTWPLTNHFSYPFTKIVAISQWMNSQQGR